MITMTVDTSLLNGRLRAVAKGVKGGLKKAVADSAGRIGISLAKSTYPREQSVGEVAVKRDMARIWPGNGWFVNQLKTKGNPQSVAIFFKALEASNFAGAENIYRKATGGASFKFAETATPADHWSQRYGSNGRVRRNPVRVWLLDDKGNGSPSFKGRQRSLLKRIGSVANGWVSASRFFRAGRGRDGLPAFKTRKQKRATGSGQWEGNGDKIVALLKNNFSFASSVMPSSSIEYAIGYESAKLASQLKAQARFEAKKARLGK